MAKKRADYEPRPYGRGDRHERQAQRMYIILVGRAVNTTERNLGERVLQAAITYGDLCGRTGYGRNAGRTRGAPLGILAEYCIANGFPCINTLVINQDSREPGDGVVTRPHKTVEQEQRESVVFDWTRYPVPTLAMLRAARRR